MATNAEVVAFIKEFGTLAVSECNRRIANGEGFVLPSVCLAQSALETGWGQSDLMKKANAFFGIKAGGSWTGAIFTADTKEVANGVEYNTVANFRAYNSKQESVRDYYDLILGLDRYAGAVSYHPDRVLTARQTIEGLQAGGYATDDEYIPKIMNTINARDLTAWDAKIDGVTVAPDDTTFADIEINTDVIEKTTLAYFQKIK